MPIWNDVLLASEHRSWAFDSTDLVKLKETDEEYSDIKMKIPFLVTAIYVVQNAKLYAKFLLKKEQYVNPRINELYHDTESKNIASIMKSNLNWRRVVRAKYGVGVSFATTPGYANYNSNGFNSIKAMIIADVLVENMETYSNRFPNSDYDTTESPDGEVIVKYCDDEFYPKYIVHYMGPGKRRNGETFVGNP